MMSQAAVLPERERSLVRVFLLPEGDCAGRECKRLAERAQALPVRKRRHRRVRWGHPVAGDGIGESNILQVVKMKINGPSLHTAEVARKDKQRSRQNAMAPFP